MKHILFIALTAVSGLVLAQPDRSYTSLFIEQVVPSEQQKVNGSIQGTVIDIDGRNPIENAVIEVLGTGVKVMTAKDGQFKLTNIGDGYYQIRCTAPDYDGQTQNNLLVEGSKPSTSFFMLKKTGSPLVSVSENSEAIPISTKSPSYPYEAKKERVEGIFYFIVEISATGAINAVKCVEKNVFADDGKVKDAEVLAKKKYVQAVNQMEKEALESIWQWKFKPAMRDGKPIMSRVTLPVKFKLSGESENKKQKGE